jgi:hypothetical protein
MSGYFDPQAEAQMNGFAHGHIDGRVSGIAEGKADGYKIGYGRGRDEGYNTGWNEAIDRANVEMIKQKEFTLKHVTAKQHLEEIVQEQRVFMEQLQARMDSMEAENVLLKTANQGLRDVVTSLQQVNEELRAEVSQLDAAAKIRTLEATDQVWQLNRCAVFMNSVRTVLEDLTAVDSPQADHVRMLFAKRYAEHVDAALKKGTIRAALDVDEVLGKTMPRTQRFIVNMLAAVEKKLANMAEIKNNTALEEPSPEM